MKIEKQQDGEPHWLSFDPKLSIGNVISIMMICIAVLAGWFRYEGRLNAQEAEISAMKNILSRNNDPRGLERRLELQEKNSRENSKHIIGIDAKLSFLVEAVKEIRARRSD